MKAYPSIPRATGQNFQEFDAYVFDKLDGRNVRVEWTQKTGWCKFGSRTRLFDASDPAFGPAIPLFLKSLADPVARVVRDQRWERVIVFMEFWGSDTLGGIQNDDGTYSGTRLSLIDVAPYKQGLLGPKQFLNLFGYLDTAKFLGRWRWTRGFVDHVRAGAIEGVTFEGVVGKSGNGKDHNLIMAKAKTQAWVDAILARCGEVEGSKIVES